jgi:hypothetical protein
MFLRLWGREGLILLWPVDDGWEGQGKEKGSLVGTVPPREPSPVIRDVPSHLFLTQSRMSL